VIFINSKGKITVEASIVIPIVLIVLFTLMYIIILNLNEVILKKTAYSEIIKIKYDIDNRNSSLEKDREELIFTEINKKIKNQMIVKYDKSDFNFNDDTLQINYYFKLPFFRLFKNSKYYSVKVVLIL
jgi:hypothetical protein